MIGLFSTFFYFCLKKQRKKPHNSFPNKSLYHAEANLGLIFFSIKNHRRTNNQKKDSMATSFSLYILIPRPANLISARLSTLPANPSFSSKKMNFSGNRFNLPFSIDYPFHSAQDRDLRYPLARAQVFDCELFLIRVNLCESVVSFFGIWNFEHLGLFRI